MKITKRQLRRIIKEEIATINKDSIEDTVMSVLSDEGGAAGLDPLQAALEDLEDEQMSLPDESIEDIVNDVPGVKRHADGDYIDTTKLESRRIKISNSDLRRIVREEREKLSREKLNEAHSMDSVQELSNIIDAVDDIANGVYQSDPELARDLEMQVERLASLHDKLERSLKAKSFRKVVDRRPTGADGYT